MEVGTTVPAAQVVCINGPGYTIVYYYVVMVLNGNGLVWLWYVMVYYGYGNDLFCGYGMVTCYVWSGV